MIDKRTGLFVLSVLSIVVLGGCGVLATKGDISPTEDFPRLKNPKTISYRVTIRYKLGEKFTIVEHNALAKIVEKQLEASGFFSQVTRVGYNEEQIGFFEPKYSPEDEQKVRSMPNFQSDYFLEILKTMDHPGHHGGGYMYWGLLHVVSFGLIPMWIDNDVNLNIRLIDSSGQVVSREHISDNSSIWAWSPLMMCCWPFPIQGRPANYLIFYFLRKNIS